MSLVLNNVSKLYGARALWQGLSFVVEPGQLVALVGPNGSGKSTLLNCIGMLDRPSTGSIRWDGIDISRVRGRERQRVRRQSLGYLFQRYALVEHESVNRNLDFAAGGLWPWRRSDYSAELAQVGLAGRGDEPVSQLSCGDKQRVALARLMVKQPRLILADEPTCALDEANGDAVVSILKSFARAGTVVLLATHSLPVRDACDLYLNLGAEQGEPCLISPRLASWSAD